jgi:hypothetical protein
MAGYENWLQSVPTKRTRKGVRLDITVYVHPDGHGSIVVGEDQPAKSKEEAGDIFRDLWERAQGSSVSKEAPSREAEAQVSVGLSPWDQPFVGMWRDRDDLQDSTDWVRSLRREEWANPLG